ncbi:MAG TPA: prepilin peptidase [Thermoanaerobacterales bacterium]|nr:prepilin peptidase [Thermoanaerobacterales bacterium]
MFYIIIFAFGAIIGSFLNVCIYRIPLKKSIISPPSHCINCGYRLKAFDLIPIISYIFLLGRCRKCGIKISIIYPIVEIITGVLFLYSYKRFDFTFDLFKVLILISILIISTFTDIEHGIIPDKIVIPGMLIALVLNIIFCIYNLPSFIGGFLLGGGFLLLLSIISKGGMGGGDIKLFAMIGLFLGFKLTTLSLLLSFIFGSIIGLIFMILKFKKPKDTIPFGPFIALASIISVFFGDEIIFWYINRFF